MILYNTGIRDTKLGTYQDPVYAGFLKCAIKVMMGGTVRILTSAKNLPGIPQPGLW